MELTEHLLRSLVCIVILGVAAQWLATTLRLPSILLLLIFGFVAGPLTGLLDPQLVLGDLLTPIVAISVALILYEGGLSLHFKELRQFGGVVGNLVTLGAVVTWLVGAAAALLCLGLYWKLSLLLGAILVVTGPTVIVPLLRHVRPDAQIGSILRWEGIVIDSVGAILAVFIFEAIRPGSGGAHYMGLARAFLAGGGLGIAGAGLLYLMLKRYLVPDFLQNAVSLMMVIAVYSISNMIEGESGVLAVTVMGIALANQKSITVQHIVEFKENLQVLLIASLFIILAASLDFDQLKSVIVPSAGGETVRTEILERLDHPRLDSRVRDALDGLAPRSLAMVEKTAILRTPREDSTPLVAVLETVRRNQDRVSLATLLAFLAVLIVVARPLSVFLSVLRSDLSWRQRFFIAFMAPRGIVAAAVSSVFALRLADESRNQLQRLAPSVDAATQERVGELFLLSLQADLLVSITFITIIATVSFYGLGAPWVARWLKVAQPNPQGALIVGAHAWARDIARALEKEGCKVVLADTNWANWQEARMEGFEIYYGNIITEYSLEAIDLDGVGRLLSLTVNDEVNSLAALHFSEVFGRSAVYQLAPTGHNKEKGATVPKHLRGRYLFGHEITFDYLQRRWEAGARIKTTSLTAEFDFDSFKEHHGENSIPLFLIKENGKVEIITAEAKREPQAGRKLISMVG